MLEPLLRIQLEETVCWSLDWANSEVIAVGCTNGMRTTSSHAHTLSCLAGTIAVYNIVNALNTGGKRPDLPVHYN